MMYGHTNIKYNTEVQCEAHWRIFNFPQGLDILAVKVSR